MYRAFDLRLVGSVASDLKQKLFDLAATFYQTKDLESSSAFVRVGTSDAEATVSLGAVTTGYAVAILSDYPIKIRLNGASETQFTLTSNNVAAVNNGAPLPDQCVFLMTGTVTSVRVAPISGATQTANVKVFVTGDPTSSYV